MPQDDTNRGRNTDLSAANDVRLRVFAERAARDPKKLAKAIRTVRAALDLGLITIDDITGGHHT
jgi:hypothetical protein